jgi:7-carboxy-7-deazaguanine synthase
MSMSPKLGNSTPWKKEQGQFASMHEQHRLNLPVVEQFIDGYDYQLKFVVDHQNDFVEVEQILERLGNVERSHVLIMPQGTTREELAERAPWIVELCKQHGFSYTPRLHIELWGNTRGT